MSKKLFDFAKEIANERPAQLTLVIPTFIIGWHIHKASTLAKVSYYVGCLIAGAAAGFIDGELAVKRNQILYTDAL